MENIFDDDDTWNKSDDEDKWKILTIYRSRRKYFPFIVVVKNIFHLSSSSKVFSIYRRPPQVLSRVRGSISNFQFPTATKAANATVADLVVVVSVIVMPPLSLRLLPQWPPLSLWKALRSGKRSLSHCRPASTPIQTLLLI